MTLPDEFVLIDRILQSPDLAELIYKSESIMFAMDAQKLEIVNRYVSSTVSNWSPLLAVKKGDVMKYRGIKIHAV